MTMLSSSANGFWKFAMSEEAFVVLLQKTSVLCKKCHLEDILSYHTVYILCYLLLPKKFGVSEPLFFPCPGELLGFSKNTGFKRCSSKFVNHLESEVNIELSVSLRCCLSNGWLDACGCSTGGLFWCLAMAGKSVVRSSALRRSALRGSAP